jgi:hypothetical protein
LTSFFNRKKKEKDNNKNKLRIPKDWLLVSYTPDSDNPGCLVVEMMDPERGGTFTFSTKATIEDAQKWIEDNRERTLEENR